MRILPALVVAVGLLPGGAVAQNAELPSQVVVPSEFTHALPEGGAVIKSAGMSDAFFQELRLLDVGDLFDEDMRDVPADMVADIYLVRGSTWEQVIDDFADLGLAVIGDMLAGQEEGLAGAWVVSTPLDVGERVILAFGFLETFEGAAQHEICMARLIVDYVHRGELTNFYDSRTCSAFFR